MKKSICIRFAIIAASLFVIANTVACGNSAEAVCNDTLTQVCQRSSECATSDKVTQSNLFNTCMKKFNPNSACQYLTDIQRREFEKLGQSGCHAEISTCSCGPNGIVCTPSCASSLNNALSIF